MSGGSSGEWRETTPPSVSSATNPKSALFHSPSVIAKSSAGLEISQALLLQTKLDEDLAKKAAETTQRLHLQRMQDLAKEATAYLDATDWQFQNPNHLLPPQ